MMPELNFDPIIKIAKTSNIKPGLATFSLHNGCELTVEDYDYGWGLSITLPDCSIIYHHFFENSSDLFSKIYEIDSTGYTVEEDELPF